MNDETLPLVTIITPTYNRADYLSETIESVLSQDYPNVEYIVLDDGSKDNTKKIIEKYQTKLIFESHSNMGEARTVNKGFGMAHGDIIGIVNSDDPLLPGAIKEIVGFMQCHPQVGVVYPDWDIIDANGKKIEHIQTFEYSYINMLRWFYPLPGPGALIRKEVVRVLNGRDPQFQYVSDFDFWLRAGLMTEFARLPKTLATFRMHPNSASVSQTNEGMAQEHITLINKICSLPNLPQDPKLDMQEAYSSAYYIAGYVCQSCNTKVRRNYFLQAIRHAPLKYLGEYRSTRLLNVIIPIAFPRAKGISLFVKNPIGFTKAKIKTVLKVIKLMIFNG